MSSRGSIRESDVLYMIPSGIMYLGNEKGRRGKRLIMFSQNEPRYDCYMIVTGKVQNNDITVRALRLVFCSETYLFPAEGA